MNFNYNKILIIYFKKWKIKKAKKTQRKQFQKH